MSVWLEKAEEFIILVLGIGHSSVERTIIAFCGILVFFLVLKSFTKVDSGGNIAWGRRFIAAALILVSVILGVVAADIAVNPNISNGIMQKIILVVLPLIIILVVVSPILMFLLKKDYGSTLVAAATSLVAGLIVIFAVSFVIDSFTGSDKEFKNLKRRTHDIDEFINQ